jgi:CarboxypepD_reg-like domain
MKQNSMHRVLPSGMEARTKVRSKFMLFSLLFLLFAQVAMAQNQEQASARQDYTAKGLVLLDEDNSPLVGVNIYLKGTSEGTFSDANGRFEFPRKLKEGDVLIFSFVGLLKQELIVTSNLPPSIEVRMLNDTQKILGALWIDKPEKKMRKERTRRILK